MTEEEKVILDLQYNEIKHKLFEQYFPEVKKEDVKDYVVVAPVRLEENLREVQKNVDWLVLSTMVKEITAYKRGDE